MARAARRSAASVLFAALVFSGWPAHGQTASPAASLLITLFEDTDGSGGPSCGEQLVVNSGIVGTTPVTLEGVRWELALPPNVEIVPATLVVSNPNPQGGPVVILSGANAGDTAVRADLGRICPPGTCGGLPFNAHLSFRARIRDPNPSTSVSLQATLTGANFAAILTDDLNTPGPANPTVVTYPACPGGGGGTIVLSATKTDALASDPDGDGQADEGDTIRYTVQARNTGTLTAPNTVFLSEVDPSTRLVIGSVTTTAGTVIEGNTAGSTRVRVNLGTLTPSTVTIRYDVQVKTALPAAVTQVRCQGQLQSQNAPTTPTDDPDAPGTADPTVTPLDFDPDLALTKSDGGATATPGQQVAYTLTASNLSTHVAASGVLIADTVPANATFSAAGSSPGWTCTPNGQAGAQCTLALGTLGPGASLPRTFALTAASPIPAGTTQLTNTASILHDGTAGADTNPANNTATDTTPFNPATTRPDLAVTKTDQGTVATAGSTVAYDLTFTNLGNRGASGVELLEAIPLPAAFNAAASSPGWTCDTTAAGVACRLELGTLAGGGTSGTRRFAVSLPVSIPPGIEEMTNLVSIEDDGTNGPDANPANNAALDTTPIEASAELVLQKTLDPTSDLTPGGLLLWRLAYANNGTQGLDNATIRETLPAHTTFEPAAGSPGWICDAPTAGSECRFETGPIAGGSSGTAAFAARIADPLPAGVEEIANCAELIPDDSVLSGNLLTGAATQSCFNVPIPAAVPDLTIAKNDGGLTTAPGELVVYTLTYRNTGNQGATGTTLTETVPAHTTFHALASSPGWTCTPDGNAGSSCTLAIGALAANTGGSARFAVRVAASVPAGITRIVNTARIGDDGTNGPDPDPANNLAIDTTPLEIAGDDDDDDDDDDEPPSLVVLKDDLLSHDTNEDGAANPGEEVTYVVTLENTGEGAARDAAFRSPVDPYTLLVPGTVNTSQGDVLTGNEPGDSIVEVDLGTLPPGGTGTVTFSIVLVEDFPPERDHIACQGELAGGNFAPLPSDDPETLELGDPTVTPVVVVGAREGVPDIPTLSTLGGVVLGLGLGWIGWMALRFRVRPTRRSAASTDHDGIDAPEDFPIRVRE